MVQAIKLLLATRKAKLAELVSKIVALEEQAKGYRKTIGGLKAAFTRQEKKCASCIASKEITFDVLKNCCKSKQPFSDQCMSDDNKKSICSIDNCPRLTQDNPQP